MHWRIRKFGRAIRRLIEWAPVIWGNEEWDQGYLLELMEVKFRRMQKEHENDPHHGDSKWRYARQLQTCAVLMKRLRSEDYCGKEMAAHFEKWGSPIRNPRVLTEADQKIMHREFKNLCDRQEALEKQDLELFLHIFGTYYKHWWT